MNLDKFYVETILDILVQERIRRHGSFKFVGEPKDDTILDWTAVKDLAALTDYSKENPISIYNN